MASVDPRHETAAVLAELSRLLADENAAGLRHTRLRGTVAELQRRLTEDRIRILVVGESKRGKSTFTNALIGAPVLPMGVTPLTAVATTVTYGSPPEVWMSTRDGQATTATLDALPELVTEAGNPGNRRGLTSVVVRLDAPLLAEGVELVDTPGTGSVIAENTAEAEIAYQDMDAAIFVLSADPPISASERALLEKILPSSVATFVVLNKADRLTAAELAAARDFTAATVAAVAGRQMPIYLCSARQALEGAAAGPDGSGVVGIDRFQTDFTSFLRTERAAGLLTSLRRQAAGVVAQLLDEVSVTVRAAEIGRSADRRNVELFRDHLDELERRHQDADDLVTGEARRLLAELNADASRLEPAVASQVSAALAEWLPTAAGLSHAHLETRGQQVGAAVAQRVVEEWRTGWAGTLQRRLDELDVRLRAGLDRDLAALRPAARELLGVELAARSVDGALAPSKRFYYQFRVDLDAAGALAAGIRHRLPGRFGRDRAEKYLLALMDRLARQQVGRARADLQERLQTSTRTIRSSLAQHYADHGERMRDALDAAAELVRGDTKQAAAEGARLAERRRVLSALLQRCEGATHDRALVSSATGAEGLADG